jgi:MFS family permease
MFYVASFFAMVALSGFLKWKEKEASDKKEADPNAPPTTMVTEDQKKFQKSYLLVYVCAFFADWLKGPYVYALYESYGFTPSQIAYLFLAGFGASGLSGPFVGAAADVFGRRRLCIGYFVIYICSALTKPINNYLMLLIGRLLGGLGTSLLYTVFESWMVAEHNRRGYPQSLLDDTFAKSTLYNGLSAVAAGLIAQLGASMMGFVGPFMVALLPLGAGLFICISHWRDDAVDRDSANAGSKDGQDTPAGPGVAGAEVAANSTVVAEEAGIMSTIKDALTAMNSDARIWFLGMAQALFEGAMYTFVFLWTPALCEGLTKAEVAKVPYGLIFSTFMVMIMVGSSFFSMAMKQYELEMLPYAVHGFSAVCCLMTVLFLGFSYGVFISFVLFEMFCGVFFPTYGSLRAVYVPEEQRSTIMNFFRVPLNLFVIVVLIKKHSFSNEMTFGICVVAHLSSFALWHAFTLTNNKIKGNQQTKDGVKYSVVNKEEVDQEEDFGDLEGDANL